MNLSYKKILPIALAFNMGLMATLPSLAITLETSQKVFNEAAYKKKTESLKNELYLKHEKKISKLIEKIRAKIDKAIDEIVLEVKADQSRQDIKDQPSKNSAALVSDYFSRHKQDFKKTQLGTVIYKTVPVVLSQLNQEEQFVFKSLLADMIESADYAKQYDRYEAAIGAGVGMAIGFIIFATKIYSGRMANGLEDSIAGIFVFLVSSMAGLMIGDKFTLGVDAQEKAQLVQNQLKSELSNLRSDANSALEELVRSQFYPETLN